MATNDLIEVRWGSRPSNYIESDQAREYLARADAYWARLNLLIAGVHGGSEVPRPNVQLVHSPLALPAMLGVLGKQPIIVWDLGLGTTLDAMAFPMPYSQPPPVVEAILRRITSARCVVAGKLPEAEAQASLAVRLLEAAPIDRTYQADVDPEDQFEVFLLTQLQEDFALVHEFAHFLRAVRPEAFDAIADAALGVLKTVPSTGQGLLHASLGEHLDGAHSALYAAGLDPWAWYLWDRVLGPAAAGGWRTLAQEMEEATAVIRTASDHDREEVFCDLIAATVVALDGHMRGGGRTLVMGAACSRLALSNLEALLSIRAWVEEQQEVAWKGGRGPSDRQRCLNALLPTFLDFVVQRIGGGSQTRQEDVHTVLHLVEERFASRIAGPLMALDWPRMPDADPNASADKVLMLAGFLPLRPSPDNREANRAARGSLFALGNLYLSKASMALYNSGGPEREDIDEALRRHERGDWGEVTAEDAEANAEALFEEFEQSSPQRTARRGPLWSVYALTGESIFVKTSRDRTKTDVYLIGEA